MSHRKEAIYTMLAATSIGAIFGGPSPFLGGKVTKVKCLYGSIRQIFCFSKLIMRRVLFKYYQSSKHLFNQIYKSKKEKALFNIIFSRSHIATIVVVITD